MVSWYFAQADFSARISGAVSPLKGMPFMTLSTFSRSIPFFASSKSRLVNAYPLIPRGTLPEVSCPFNSAFVWRMAGPSTRLSLDFRSRHDACLDQGRHVAFLEAQPEVEASAGA